MTNLTQPGAGASLQSAPWPHMKSSTAARWPMRRSCPACVH